jgi:NAD(P)-dependent dehydrogenase (short-subunit alcohol dehydrogenase family)
VCAPVGAVYVLRLAGQPDALRAALVRVPVDLADLNAKSARLPGPVRSLRAFAAYGRTKNMNAMFAYALARTRIAVNGAHLGIISGTGLGRGARSVMKVPSHVTTAVARKR